MQICMSLQTANVVQNMELHESKSPRVWQPKLNQKSPGSYPPPLRDWTHTDLSHSKAFKGDWFYSLPTLTYLKGGWQEAEGKKSSACSFHLYRTCSRRDVKSRKHTTVLQMHRWRASRVRGCISFLAVGLEAGSGCSREVMNLASWGRFLNRLSGKIRCLSPLRACKRSEALMTGLNSSKNKTPCK